MTKIITILVISLLLIAVGWFSRGWYIEDSVGVIDIDTTYNYHTITDSGETWKPSIIKVPYIITQEVNLDSLWEEAKAFYARLYRDSLSQSGVIYVAQKDTSYKDSTLSANVSFNSPIPLHPNSYFYMDFLFREIIIDSTLTIDNTYSDTWSIGLGIRNQLMNQRIQAIIIGDVTYKFINSKHFEILARVRGEYLDGVTGSLESEGRFKF